MSERELRNEVKFTRKALERLASMEAFDLARAVVDPQDNELLARIMFAEGVLDQLQQVGEI